jgi:hypothetical protein
MEFTEHKSGQRYWRHRWTKARSRERLSKATLKRHRQTAIDFCLAETATRKTGPVVPSEHDAYLAERSLLYNGDQHGGGCLIWGEDTIETERGDFTYRLNVGDDVLSSERKARESKRSSQRGSRKSTSKNRDKDDRTEGDRGTCVAS